MSLETKKQAFRPDLLKHLSSADSFTRLLDGVAEENRLDIALIGADLAQIYRTPEQDLVELPPVDMLLSAVMQNRAVITVLPGGAPAAIFPISSDTFNVAVVVSYPAEYDVDDVLRFGYELVRLQAYFRDNDGGEQAVSLNNAIIAQHLFVEDRKSVFALLADEFRISPFSGEPLFRADYVVASICTRKGGVTAEMQQALSRYVPDTFSMEKNGSLCAFMHGLKPGGLNSNQVLVEALKNYCGAYELRCVLSSPFSELNMRFKYMEQAELLSASFAEEGRLGLICADDEFTRTVLSGAIDKLGAELLCLTDIQRIADYDRENGTNYLDTLEKYLSCANRFTEASKELYIDRGTLKYRLNKIRSLIFCDPEEPGIAQRLRYAVYIYRKSGEKTGMD